MFSGVQSSSNCIKRCCQRDNQGTMYYNPKDISPLNPAASPPSASRRMSPKARAKFFHDIDTQGQQLTAVAGRISLTLNNLRKRRNTASPIHRLPQELLTIIFRLAARAGAHSDDIVAISHVCSLWREMALSDARLWTTIHIPSHSKACEFLRRSKRRLVDVYIDNFSSDSDTYDFIAMLKTESCRIRSLTVHSFKTEAIMPMQSLLLMHVPQLEELTLCWEWGQHCFLGSNPFHGHTPKLRSLTLAQHSFNWTSSIFSNLTKLSLVGQLPIGHPHSLPSIRQFLRILQACPDLQELKVECETASLEAPAVGSFEPFSRISLEHLEVLQIMFLPPDWIGNILARISIPSTARVTVRMIGEEDWTSDCFDPLWTDSSLDFFPMLASIRRFELYFDEKKGLVVHANNVASASINEPPFTYGVSDMELRSALEDAMLLFDLSDVSVLTLGSPHVAEEKRSYLSLLHSMPQLHTLRLVELSAEDLQAIFSLLTSSLSADAGPAEEEFLFPAMQHLEIVSSDMKRQSLRKALQGYLRVRSRTLSPIKSVELIDANGWTEAEIHELGKLCAE
ncbi:uncharacterized protein LAESUDRAFT_748102, partial [Laetiporus sulphureus 93-53]